VDGMMVTVYGAAYAPVPAWALHAEHSTWLNALPDQI